MTLSSETVTEYHLWTVVASRTDAYYVSKVMLDENPGSGRIPGFVWLVKVKDVPSTSCCI